MCAYTRDELPADAVQVFHRFERTVVRAGLSVRVRLMPLEDLPDSFEVLVVPPELRERANAAARASTVIVTTRATAGEAAGALVRALERGDEIYAERLRPDDPRMVVRRGSEIL